MRQNILIRTPGGIRRAGALVLGEGLRVTETAGGLPELLGVAGGDLVLQPSGGDDTQAIQDALATGRDVRLGPGTFQLSDTVTLGVGGVRQRLIGNGASRTFFNLTAPVSTAVVTIESGGCGVEGLSLAGSWGPGHIGIRAVLTVGGPVTLRDLAISFKATGIHLENVYDAEVSRVTIAFSALGIYARDITRSTLRNARLVSALTGIRIENGTSVSCESIYANGEDDFAPYAISISGGTGYRLAQIQAETFVTAVTLVGAFRSTAESLSIENCQTGLLIDQTRDLTVNASEVWLCYGSALVVRNSENVVVGAFRSNNTLGTAASPQVRVESSAGVFVTGMRIQGISSSAYDVDVSLAGARVLFGPHNFTPARINSGGNFAQL